MTSMKGRTAVTDVTIGIVSYNTLGYLQQCLRSIDRADLQLNYDIVVVDNASSDDTTNWIMRQRPDVRLVPNAENVGIARGNNQCIQNGAGRYVLLLNNDTEIIPGTVERMASFLDAHADVGAVGGKRLNPDGSFQGSFSSFPSLKEEFLIVSHLGVRFVHPRFPSPGDVNEEKDVDWINSACLLVRREAMMDIGMIDESYFIYSDETDFQYRLWQSGWRVHFLPDVTTIHYGGRSLTPWRRNKLVYRGRMLFARKHYGRLYSLVQRFLFAGFALARVGIWTLGLPFAQYRERAQNEIPANLDIVRMSWSLQ